jgi:hypothetical protein
MFRGGDYVDQPGFADPHKKGARNYMDVSDITGA